MGDVLGDLIELIADLVGLFGEIFSDVGSRRREKCYKNSEDYKAYEKRYNAYLKHSNKKVQKYPEPYHIDYQKATTSMAEMIGQEENSIHNL